MTVLLKYTAHNNTLYLTTMIFLEMLRFGRLRHEQGAFQLMPLSKQPFISVFKRCFLERRRHPGSGQNRVDYMSVLHVL